MPGKAEGCMRGETREAKGPGTGYQRQRDRRGRWRGDWRRTGVDAAWPVPNWGAGGGVQGRWGPAAKQAIAATAAGRGRAGIDEGREPRRPRLLLRLLQRR